MTEGALLKMEKTEEFLRSLGRFGIKLGLERIRKMLELAGEPQRSFPSVLVGGTNGKGSTVAFLSHILRAAGLRVGTFSSPHLVSYRERVQIDGNPIPESDFERLGLWAKGFAERVAKENEHDWGHPTEFEVLTLMGFQYFAEQKVDFAVIEVGMGGRFDSTNTLEPLVSVVTNISLDHTDRLGNTLIEIAREKFGIARCGVPFVTSERKPVVFDYFQRRCLSLGAPLVHVGREVVWRKISGDASGLKASFKTWKAEYPELRTRMLGDFQLANLGCALAALECLREGGFAVPNDAIYEGVLKANCPGRLQVVREYPTVVLDGAHNVAATAVVARSLRGLFSPGESILVVGIMADKDVDGMLGQLVPLFDRVIATNAQTSRALPCQELAKRCASWKKPTMAIGSVWEAYQSALAEISENGLVCVSGSLYVVGEVLAGLSNGHETRNTQKG